MDYGHPVRRSGRLAGKRVRVYAPSKARLHKRRRVVPGMKKRRRTGVRRGQPYKRRRTTSKESSDYTQQKFVNIHKGKRMSTRRLVDSAVMNSMNKVVYQAARYNREPVNANAYQWDIGQVIAGGKRTLPMYIACLSNVVQGTNGGSVFLKRAYCDIAGIDDGLIKWQDEFMQNSAGSSTDKIQRVYDADLNASVFARSMMQWVDLKFNMMGPRQRPTQFLVQIVRLPNQEVNPWVGVVGGFHQSFWSKLVTPYTCNSIHQVTDRFKGPEGRLQVLASRKFEFQPTSTTESDARGHVVTCKWFWRCNKLMDYRGRSDAFITDDNTYNQAIRGTNIGTGLDGIGQTQIDQPKDPKSTLYLLIRAMCPDPDVTVNQNLHPTWEFNIRTCHTKLDRS